MLTNAVTPDKLGGLERYVRELSASLVKKGHHVEVLTKRAHPDLPADEVGEDGVRLLRYAMPSLSDPLFVPKRVLGPFMSVRRESRRRVPRVLHAHFPVPALPLAAAGPHYLYTFHAPVHKEVTSERQGRYALPRMFESTAIHALKLAERSILQRASRVVVLSGFMGEEVGDLSRRVVRRTRTIPGGIDTHQFRPGPPIADPWVGAGTPLLFTARRLTPRTGVAELIDAMPHIRRRAPGARLVVAGEGRVEDALRARAAALGADHRDAVRLIGRVSDRDLVGWYRGASLVVMPTQELEGFGLTSAEALACGTPVVATPAGANPEVVGGLDGGLIASGVAPASIAEAVSRLLAVPDRLAALSAAARPYALRYGWDAVADRHVDLYREIAL